MFINNLKLINKAFDLLKNEEEKTNYCYEPMFPKKNKEWKRHFNYYELKKDFVKEINDYGFSPYFHETCEEQLKNKIILKFSKKKDYNYTKYIKKINKYINSTKKNETPKSGNNISYENKRCSDLSLKKPKLKEYKSKSFLGNLYRTIHDESIINKNKRKSNSCVNDSETKGKLNNLTMTKIIKFSREGIVDKKMNKEDLFDSDNSFIFEKKSKIKTMYDLYKLNNKIANKKDNYRINDSSSSSNMFNNDKKVASPLNCKVRTFSHSKLYKTILKDDFKRIKSSKKISKLRKNNTFLTKKNNINYYKIDSSNSNIFTRNKKIYWNLSYINDYNSFNHKNNNKKQNLYNEKEGIFKLAVKYDYKFKKLKKIVIYFKI